MKLKNLSLRIDVYVGSDITQTCREATALANHLKLGVWFNFNGIETLARVGDDPKRIEDEWRKALEKHHQTAATK
jgi:hypothetical protein